MAKFGSNRLSLINSTSIKLTEEDGFSTQERDGALHVQNSIQLESSNRKTLCYLKRRCWGNLRKDGMSNLAGDLDLATHLVRRSFASSRLVARSRFIRPNPLSRRVALAWLRYRPVPVIPIIGARKLAQIEDNIRSLDVKISSEQLQRLDKASAVPLGFPHNYLAMDPVRAMIYGGMRDRIRA